MNARRVRHREAERIRQVARRRQRRRLRVLVDGRPVRGDPTAITLASHQEIVVAFGTAAQLPSPIPSAYRFPPGL